MTYQTEGRESNSIDEVQFNHNPAKCYQPNNRESDWVGQSFNNVKYYSTQSRLPAVDSYAPRRTSIKGHPPQSHGGPPVRGVQWTVGENKTSPAAATGKGPILPTKINFDV